MGWDGQPMRGRATMAEQVAFMRRREPVAWTYRMLERIIEDSANDPNNTFF